MSDFLSIAPDGWVQLESAWITPDGSLGEVQFWIQQEGWIDIENVLLNSNLMPEGKHIVNARLVYLNDGVQLWALLA